MVLERSFLHAMANSSVLVEHLGMGEGSLLISFLALDCPVERHVDHVFDKMKVIQKLVDHRLLDHRLVEPRNWPICSNLSGLDPQELIAAYYLLAVGALAEVVGVAEGAHYPFVGEMVQDEKHSDVAWTVAWTLAEIHVAR